MTSVLLMESHLPILLQFPTRSIPSDFFFFSYWFLFISSFHKCWSASSLFELYLLFSRKAESDSATSWTAGHQVSLPFTISQSLLKLMCIELVMSPNHLILCHPLFFLPSIFCSIRVISNESALCIRWPKY